MSELIDDKPDRIIDEALQRFVNSQLHGQKIDIEELIKQYPEFEQQIRKRIKKFQRINNIFDSLSHVGEKEFEDVQLELDLVGRKIASFEIVKIIGRGGMGVVYLARDTKLKRSVAIKCMPTRMTADPTARIRFNREAELLASLNHPNIAVIHEMIEEEKSGYLVLEYVPGQTLAERISKGPLKLQEILTIALQIAEAVAAAHEHNIIHRDLKPGNIKITPDGRVKVLDFGLAKPPVSEDKSNEIALTQTSRIMGTPAYMSPEQARGKDTDNRTDIWSFGCIMYQMLTGKLPFEGETATDTLACIIECEPDWKLLLQDTPANIRELLQRCLEKEPERRLGNIGDATIEIGETLSSPPVTIPSKLRRMAVIIGAVAFGIILSGIALRFIPQKEFQPSSKEIRLVVLPFENLGPTEDEYFADGITDAITARLAIIHGLGVISRQSAMQYKTREKSTRTIREELGVDYILEGTVQRERPSDPTSRVRIIPQLIRASDDIHVWAQTYEDDISEVFRLQSDLAERVAQALDITILEPERGALKAKPTENIEAYNYYLRGNEYFHRSNLESDLTIAIQMYKKAIGLDPTFALAYAQLSRAHVSIYWSHYDHSEARLALGKQAVDKAFQRNPNLPEAHLALGQYYYHGHLDYERALEQFAIARTIQPNNSELLGWIGYVQRRQGKFEQALANIKKASKLDPLSNVVACEVGLTFMALRKYPEAKHYYERAISLAPDVSRAYNAKAWVYLRWQGSTEKACTVLKEGLQNIRSEENVDIIDSLFRIAMYKGEYQEALDQLSLISEAIDNASHFIPNALRYAQIYRYTGDDRKAEEHFERAIGILKYKIVEDPNDARYRSSLGIAYAGLGRKEDAIREGKLGVELLPVTKEAMGGQSKVVDLASIYVMVGEFDAAIDQLEFLLSKPGWTTVSLLRLDPAWDPLRNHPRFEKLMETYK